MYCLLNVEYCCIPNTNLLITATRDCLRENQAQHSMHKPWEVIDRILKTV